MSSLYWPGMIKPEWVSSEADIWNPYFKEVCAIIKTSEASVDPHDFYNITFKSRDAMKMQYGFAIPNREAIEAIKPYSPILEAGAGTGYWAEVLRRSGIDVLAVDNRSGTYSFSNNDSAPLDPYNGQPILDADAVKEIPKHPKRNLFLCWPDYGTSFAFDCLSIFQRCLGRYVIYIGEGEGGCTGDDAFHEVLQSDFKEVVSVDIPQWRGLHDYLAVYERKRK